MPTIANSVGTLKNTRFAPYPSSFLRQWHTYLSRHLIRHAGAANSKPPQPQYPDRRVTDVFAMKGLSRSTNTARHDPFF